MKDPMSLDSGTGLDYAEKKTKGNIGDAGLCSRGLTANLFLEIPPSTFVPLQS